MPPSDLRPSQPSIGIATVGAPVAPKAPEGTDRLAITIGFLLISGIGILMLMVALRFLRRAADPETHGYGRRTPTRGFERGRARDPWTEAGRRLVVPPAKGESHNGEESEGDDDEPDADRPDDGDDEPRTPEKRR
ncbi:MAG: hypothetical protein JNL80_16735 [Phycisphaerae bacterium]|jgi:hypothetical protein|nr:hypothetical protein [Phycisphaerae bacterium]